MVSHLKRRFAGRPAVEDEAGLRILVREGRELARRFGIVQDPDVRTFLELMTEHGREFHSLPWAAKILSDTTLSGTGKVESLDRYSLFALRR